MMKRQYRLLLALVLLLTTLIPASAVPRPADLTFSPTVASAATTGTLITRVYTDKARYNVGNAVVITAELKNTTGASWTGTLSLSIKKLETQVHTATTASF